MCFQVRLWIALMTLVIFADSEVEKVPPDTHSPIDVEHFNQGEHNEDFDHQAILGPDHDAYDKLPPQVAKEKLKQLAVKMDKNHDKYVQENELTEWILNSFLRLDEQDAHEHFTEQDINNDGHVDWGEIIQKVYGYKLEELEKHLKDKSEEMKEFIQMINWDKRKFDVADSDSDGQLDVDEFAAYFHPENYKHMHEVEIQRVLEEHDKNKDGFIDLKEFIGDVTSDKEHEIYEKEQFQAFDINKDGKLQTTEIQDWVLPDQHVMAKEEAQHLFSETDTNKDMKLSYTEIVDKHQLWVGSQATDYGRQMHDNSEL